MEAVMVAALVVVMLAVVVGLVRRPRRHRPRPQSPTPVDEPGFDDPAILSAQAGLTLVLWLRLATIMRRGCPVGYVGPSPVAGTCRVCFADGTVVIARARPGELGRLAVATKLGRVRLVRLDHDGPEVAMHFVHARGQLDAIATGLDQAD